VSRRRRPVALIAAQITHSPFNISPPLVRSFVARRSAVSCPVRPQRRRPAGLPGWASCSCRPVRPSVRPHPATRNDDAATIARRPRIWLGTSVSEARADRDLPPDHSSSVGLTAEPT